MKLPPHDHPVIESYVSNQIALVERYINLTPTTRVLEIGCGYGYFTTRLNQICDVCGIDIDAEKLRHNPVARTQVMDAAHMDFEDDTFDVVYCHQTLHVAAEMDAIVREMKRVSKGHIVIVEPNNLNPLSLMVGVLVRSEKHALRFSLEYVRQVARRNGLRIVDSFSYGLMAPPLRAQWVLPVAELLYMRSPFGLENFVITAKDRAGVA